MTGLQVVQPNLQKDVTHDTIENKARKVSKKLYYYL